MTAKPDTKAEKRGNKSWRPFNLLEVTNKTPGFRFRWCDKDPANLDKKAAEGWKFVPSSNAKYKKPDATITTGSYTDIEYADCSTTSMVEYRESILMALDEETAQERDAYFKRKTEQQAVLTPKQRAEQAAKNSGLQNAKFYEPTTID